MRTRVTRSVFIDKELWEKARDMKINISAVTEQALKIEIDKILSTVVRYNLKEAPEHPSKVYRKQ